MKPINIIVVVVAFLFGACGYGPGVMGCRPARGLRRGQCEQTNNLVWEQTSMTRSCQYDIQETVLVVSVGINRVKFISQ